MNQEQITEFHGILEENGWTKLTVKDLSTIKKLIGTANMRGQEVIEFRGKEMLVKFGEHILWNYVEYGDNSNDVFKLDK